jgi:hypothetical protein
MTTVARGRCTSAPELAESAIGKNPSEATSAGVLLVDRALAEHADAEVVRALEGGCAPRGHRLPGACEHRSGRIPGEPER